jgi:hypothetical protein
MMIIVYLNTYLKLLFILQLQYDYSVHAQQLGQPEVCNIPRRSLKQKKSGPSPGALLKYTPNGFNDRRAITQLNSTVEAINKIFSSPNTPTNTTYSHPYFKKGSLGRCAFVSQSSEQLKTQYGAFIDKHDSIFRYGRSPTKGFEKHVGTKTTLMMIRTKTVYKGCTDPRKDRWDTENNIKSINDIVRLQPDVAFVTFEGHVHILEKCNGFVVPGMQKPLYIIPQFPELLSKLHSLFRSLAPFVELTKGLQKSGKISRETLRPTNGFMAILTLMATGYCSHVNGFGFSKNGNSPHYFLAKRSGSFTRGSTVKALHSIGLENYLLRVATSQAHMCLY